MPHLRQNEPLSSPIATRRPTRPYAEAAQARAAAFARATSREFGRRGAWPVILMLACLMLTAVRLSAQQPVSGTIVTLADPPTPDALVAARTALAQGAIVTMTGGDWASFDGFLGLGVRPQNEDPGVPELLNTLRIIAAHEGPENAIHEYECYSTPPTGVKTEQQYEEDCEAAFNRWVGEETASSTANAIPEPLEGDYTALLRIAIDTSWDYGTNYERIRTYRVNDIDPNRDWYLVVRDPATAPNFQGCTNSNILAACGWVTGIRDYQTSLFVYNPDNSKYKFFEAAPSGNLGDAGTLSIGAGLAGYVPFAGVEYSMNWGQSRVTTSTYINQNAKEASWVENFGWVPVSFERQTAANSQYFQTHNAMIYEVPEGTTYFHVTTRTYLENFHYVPNKAEAASFSGGATLEPPEFWISTNNLTLLPNGKGYVQLTAALPYNPALPPEWRTGNIAWTAQLGQGTEGFSISQSQGTGSTILTINATNAAPGATGTIEINTNPPYASPSVVLSPLILNVKVASNVSPRVLLAGGQDWSDATLSSAELWDPSTGNSILTGSMANARTFHTATQLEDGRVLVAGGYDANSSAQKSVEFFNPANNQFVSGPDLLQARAEQTATLITHGALAGDVLIAGGCDQSGNALKNAELYDPRTNSFSWTPDMLQVHMRHTATELADGRILIVGGTLSKGSYTGIGEAEIFDPATQEWSYAANLREGRQGHSATLLTTGQVLVAGGWNPITDPIATAELYTPTSRTFTYTLGQMSLGRRYQAAVPLLNGDVLLGGGFNAPSTADLFNPGSQTFQTVAGTMTEERDRPTATYLLNTETAMDGNVLFAGGVYPGSGSSNGKLLEVFDPSTGTFTASGSMTTARRGLTATLIGTSY